MIAYRLAGYDDYRRAADCVYQNRPGGDEVLASMTDPGPDERFTWYAAVAKRPVAIAAVSMIGDCAVLVALVSDPTLPGACYSRYLLHTCVVNDLIQRGIRFLAVGSVLLQTDGLRYFQNLIGYRVCNLRPIIAAPPSSETTRVARPRDRLLMRGPVVAAGER